MKQLDLNADLAEGFPFDEALLKLITSANIACGLHAGGAIEMRNAVKWAKENNVRIGAHPGFPDRENFGRKNMPLKDADLTAYLHYQLGALQAICDAQQAELIYVKPHGALYNEASNDPHLAQVIIHAVRDFNPALKLMGLSGSLLLRLAEEAGLATISEVFADRHYQPNGMLVPRTQPNAMVNSDEEAIMQVCQMLDGTVTAVGGSTVSVKAESVCLHGDNVHALQFARQIRDALQQQKIRVTA